MNSKKLFFLFVLFLFPLTTFAGILERYCFQEPNGTFYDLRGGKLGKKAFTVQATNVNCPAAPLTGIATFAQVSTGYALTMLISRDSTGACSSYVLSTLVDVNLISVSGNFDNLPRNILADGPFSASRVACPISLSPVKPTGKPFPGPGAGKLGQ